MCCREVEATAFCRITSVNISSSCITHCYIHCLRGIEAIHVLCSIRNASSSDRFDGSWFGAYLGHIFLFACGILRTRLKLPEYVRIRARHWHEGRLLPSVLRRIWMIMVVKEVLKYLYMRAWCFSCGRPGTNTKLPLTCKHQILMPA